MAQTFNQTVCCPCGQRRTFYKASSIASEVHTVTCRGCGGRLRVVLQPRLVTLTIKGETGKACICVASIHRSLDKEVRS